MKNGSIRSQLGSVIVLFLILMIATLGIALNGIMEINQLVEQLPKDATQILPQIEKVQENILALGGIGILLSLLAGVWMMGNLNSFLQRQPKPEESSFETTALTDDLEKITSTTHSLQKDMTVLSKGSETILDHVRQLNQIAMSATDGFEKNIDPHELARTFDQLVHTLERIEKEVRRGQDSNMEDQKTVEKVNELASLIQEVAKKIKDMASHTSTLALNAEIEAAKAGEQGKGFAVVAEEMATIADNIKKLTEKIENFAHEAVTAVELTKNAIEETGGFLQKVVEQTNNGMEIVEKLQETTVEDADSAKNLQGILSELQQKCTRGETKLDTINLTASQQVDIFQDLLKFTNSLETTIKNLQAGQNTQTGSTRSSVTLPQAAQATQENINGEPNTEEVGSPSEEVEEK